MKKDHHVPKGCMAVMVGHEGQEQKRFVIPVIYIYHPLFIDLLKEAEEEYGFDHRGPINIPCDVQQFSNFSSASSSSSPSSKAATRGGEHKIGTIEPE
ncbi:auxin-responsive protein SAUR32-like protein [Tanacetum coccineum]